MDAKSKKWTEGMVFALLEKRFQAPAYVLLPQVRNGTGFSRKRDRTCDAVAISTWPSRGLSISGIEIKVSRSDWRKELADPQKSSDFMKFCDYWFVAAPKGVVDEGEVPQTWGYLECPTVNSMRNPIGAAKLQPPQIDMLLLCSILRNAAECMTPKETVRAQVNELVERKLEHATSLLQHRINELEETMDDFEKASGISLSKKWDAGNIGDAVKFVRDTGVQGAKATVRRLRDNAKGVSDRLTEALDEFT